MLVGWEGGGPLSLYCYQRRNCSALGKATERLGGTVSQRVGDAAVVDFTSPATRHSTWVVGSGVRFGAGLTSVSAPTKDKGPSSREIQWRACLSSQYRLHVSKYPVLEMWAWPL